jgi:hypothetical protein
MEYLQPSGSTMHRRILLPLFLVGFVAGSAVLVAQAPFYLRGGRVEQGVMPEERTGFTFCRLMYRQTYRESSGSGWDTDYPMADQNLMVRLSELTKTDITRYDEGAPQHALVNATDDALFECPFLYAADAGTIGWDAEEIARMREYLFKGGLFWVDDFWGDLAWDNWLYQIHQVLPEYEVVELPLDHPLFSAFYFVETVPQIPSIQSWRRSGGATSERGAETVTPRVSAIFDDGGRLLVLMSHNTDIADGWEREGEDWEFFHSFSPYGYAVGINIAIWSMTH